MYTCQVSVHLLNNFLRHQLESVMNHRNGPFCYFLPSTFPELVKSVKNSFFKQTFQKKVVWGFNIPAFGISNLVRQSVQLSDLGYPYKMHQNAKFGIGLMVFT